MNRRDKSSSKMDELNYSSDDGCTSGTLLGLYWGKLSCTKSVQSSVDTDFMGTYHSKYKSLLTLKEMTLTEICKICTQTKGIETFFMSWETR